jgi:hypothetical protein
MIILLYLLTVIGCQMYSCVPSGITCLSNCCCSANMTCNFCMSYHGDNGGICVPCSDSLCISCSFGGAEACTSCDDPYLPNLDIPDQCILCDESTASGC